MFQSFIQRSLPVVLAFSALSAQAQFYKLHGASASVGIAGQFSTPVTSEDYPGGLIPQQYTTNSAGLIASLAFHPKPWAGVEVNYGFSDYSERYALYHPDGSLSQFTSIASDMHEATAAYQFHPRHIPFQPFVNLGGGGIDFVPRYNHVSDQWRLAGLAETGFDIVATRDKKAGFRIEARSLIYRAPDFNQRLLRSDSWTATVEPAASFFYRF